MNNTKTAVTAVKSKFKYEIKSAGLMVMHGGESTRADDVRAVCGKISQCGIKHIVFEGRNTHVMTSNSVKDIAQSICLDKWTHSQNPKGINAGDRIIVIPNLALTKRDGKEHRCCVEFAAAGPAVKNGVDIWCSEKV